MTTGSPDAGHTDTKAPPASETMPGSVLIAAIAAATATSTALPPASATSRPAASDTGPVAAIATRPPMG